MADIFISYSRKDIAFARLLNQALSSSDLDTWIDWERIPVGEQWWNEIREAIEQSNIFMFIISKYSLGSPVCKDEINIALQNNKRIIPIILDDLTRDSIDAFIPDLSKIQWIVFQRDQTFQVEELPGAEAGSPEDQSVAKPKPPFFDEAITKLNTYIHIDWEWVKYHTRLQNDALQWDNNNRNESFLLRGEVLEQAETATLAATQKEPRLTQLQVEFINKSRQVEKRQQEEKQHLEKQTTRRLRWVIAVVIVGLMAAIFLGINWYVQSVRAKTAEKEAINQENARATMQVQAEIASTQAIEQKEEAQKQESEARSRLLAAQALLANESRFDLSVLLSLESLNIKENNEAKSTLLTAFEDHPALEGILHNEASMVGCFDPSGQLFVTGYDDGTIKIWDISHNNAGILIQTFVAHEAAIESLVFSPDGMTLASSSEDRSINLWDVSGSGSPQRISQIVGDHTGPVDVVAFSSDGKILASGNNNGSIVLWDISDLKSPKQLGQPILVDTLWITSVIFTQQDQVLIVNGSDGIIKLWGISNPEQPQLLGEISTGLIFIFRGVSVSRDGKMLAASQYASVYLWDITDPTSPSGLATFSTNNSNADDVFLYPDGQKLSASTDDGTLWLWDISNPQFPETLNQPVFENDKVFLHVIFSADGKRMASLNGDGDIELWNIANPAFPQAISQPFGEGMYSDTGFTVSRDGDLLVTGNFDETRFWNISNPSDPHLLSQPFQDITGRDDAFTLYVLLALNPDTNTLVRYDGSEKLNYWDISNLDSPTLSGELPFSQGILSKIVMSPNGKLLATDRLSLFDFSDTKNPLQLEPFTDSDWVNTVTFFGEENNLAVANADNTVLLWDLSDLQNPQKIGQPLSSFTDYVSSMAFNVRRNILATGSADSKIWLWDLSDPENPQTLGQPVESDGDTVYELVFSPEGNMMASAGENQIQLWDISDPTLKNKIGLPLQGHTWPIQNLAFTKDGKYLISVDPHDFVWLWNLDLETWKSQACTIANRNLTYDEWQQYLPNKAYRFTCPDIPIASSGVGEYIDLAESALAANDQATAELAYTQAMNKLTDSENATFQYEICRHGSLDGIAEVVLPACEMAVSLAEQDENLLSEYRFSRGIALALTGDYAGAAEDIQYYLDHHTQEMGDYGVYWAKKRESWIAALKSGSNPFDENTVAELRQQAFSK